MSDSDCFECNEGYHITGTSCTRNICTCANGGTAATGAACPTHGSAKCVSCSGDFYLDANDACTAWDTCTEGTTCQTTAPTNTVNRQCSNVNVCAKYQYMDVAPTLQHNGCGTCASHRNCTDAQYESLDETTTSNRETALRLRVGGQAL